MNTSREKRAALFFTAGILCCSFLMLPGTLLFYPAWNVHCFETGTVVLLSIGAMCWFPQRLYQAVRSLSTPILTAGAILTLLSLYQVFRHAGIWQIEDTGLCFLYTAVPLFGLVFREELLRLLPGACGLFFLWNLAVSIQNVTTGSVCAGIPSNINWNAALTVFTGACFFYGLQKSDLKTWIRVTLMILTGLGILWILSVTRCRAVILGCTMILPLILYKSLESEKAKSLFRAGLLLLILLLAASAVSLLKQPAIMEKLRGQDRFFFYTSVPSLILEAPVLGHGLPSFEEAYIPHRTPAFFQLKSVPTRTNHPHNDLLFLAVGTGITGALCWIVILACILIPYYRRRGQKAGTLPDLLFYLFLLLLIHAQLDLIFYHIPLAFVSLILPGILYGGIAGEKTYPDLPGRIKLYLRICSGILCAAALFAVSMNFVSSQMLRQAKTTHTEERTAQTIRQLTFLPQVPVRVLYKALFLDQQWDLAHPAEALQIIRKIRESAVPDYAHVNFMQAMLCESMKDYAGAEKYSIRESEIYHLHVIPLLHLNHLYQITNQSAKQKLAENWLKEVMRQRNLDERDLMIIMSHPEYDLRPWDIPAAWRTQR